MELPFSLGGKTVLVTGATSGIGRETAIVISHAGAKLALTGRDKNRLAETMAQLKGDGHSAFAADLLLDGAVESLLEALPRLDGVVYSSGITSHLPAKFIGRSDYAGVMDTNFGSVVLLTAKLLKRKLLCDKASLVFVSSIASKYPYFGGALYSASKAAIEAYSRTLAIELGNKGIRSNCVSPSFVKTPMVEGAADTISGEVMARFEKMMPLGFGKPADVAHAVVYLLSDAALWVTGANLTLGGS